MQLCHYAAGEMKDRNPILYRIIISAMVINIGLMGYGISVGSELGYLGISSVGISGVVLTKWCAIMERMISAKLKMIRRNPDRFVSIPTGWNADIDKLLIPYTDVPGCIHIFLLEAMVFVEFKNDHDRVMFRLSLP